MAGMSTGHRLALLLTGLLIAGGSRAAAQEPAPLAPEVRAHVEAFFAALASGQPGAFEAMARVHCTPALLERRTALQRAEMVRRVHDDFGTMTLDAIRPDGDQIALDIRGATGLRGRAMLTLEVAPPRRIDRFGIDLQAGGGAEGPPAMPPPVTADMSDEAFDTALDAYLTARTQAGEFSGVVLVEREGHRRFARGYGEADRTTHLANTPALRFDIGSINKSFTQVAVAQLIAAGRLKATDAIGTLLPDYPNAEARVATVQQLLDHRGGIADLFGPQFDSTAKDTLRTNRDYFRLVAPQPLTFAPGTSRRYCNGCYVVLGEIIARVSGQAYEAYVTEHVFTPAGMTSTGFLRPGPGQGAAQGYTTRGVAGAAPQVNSGMLGAGGSAAGGAHSTAADLLAYVEALRADRLIARADAARVLGDNGPGGQLAMAGGAPGLNALVHASPGVVVIVLANMDPPHAERLGDALARQLSR